MQMHYLSVFTNPKIAGLALWQFADIPIDRLVSTDDQRPRGLNNKGQGSSGLVKRDRRLATNVLRRSISDGSTEPVCSGVVSLSRMPKLAFQALHLLRSLAAVVLYILAIA